MGFIQMKRTELDEMSSARTEKMKDGYSINDLLSDMDEIFKRFLFARSLTPYLSEDAWKASKDSGCALISTAPLYVTYGFYGSVCFNNDNVNYNDWFDTGNWINKSFFIHMYALLDNLCIVKYLTDCLRNKHDRESDIWDLLKHLRNAFAHSERYIEKLKDRTNKDYLEAVILQKKLYPLICSDDNKLNMSINEFIMPFYPELRNVLINQLSKYESFHHDKDGKLICCMK